MKIVHKTYISIVKVVHQIVSLYDKLVACRDNCVFVNMPSVYKA